MENIILETQKKLRKELNIDNIMRSPKIEKIVVNVGFGKELNDKKSVETIFKNLGKITGQKPAPRKAKKAIASFKIREDQIIGAKVTLRGKKMIAFYQKLVNIVLPRVRDFRGMPNRAFDGNGNYTLGFEEMNVFPEIEYRKGEKQFGFEITIKTSTKSDKEAKKLLETMGLPFKKEDGES